MKYMRDGSVIVARLLKGEEFTESVKSLCEKEHFSSGRIQAIGAVKRAVLGYFDTEEKKYVHFECKGELASCMGNIAKKDDDIVVFDGSPVLKSIAEGRVRKELFTDINKDIANRLHSVHDTFLDEWRIYTPSVGSDTYPNQCWIYRIKSNEWCFDQHRDASTNVKDHYMTGSGKYRSLHEPTWNEMTDAWSTYTSAWNALSTRKSRYEKVVIGLNDNKVYIEDEDLAQEKCNTSGASGEDVQMVAETQDFVGENIDSFDRLQELDVHYEGTNNASDTITVEASEDGGENYTSHAQTFNTSESAIRRRFRAFFNLTGRTHRLKYTGRKIKLFGQKLFITPQGRR